MTRRRTDDAGASLAELLVTLAVMSVVMVLFTGAIVQIYRTVNATEALSDSQNELSRAFQRFDRELRYASWIADPSNQDATSTGPWYVEFAGPDPTTCFQLQLMPGAQNKGVLRLLTWTRGAPLPAGTPGQTIASQVDTTAARRPFFEKQAYGATPYASPTATPSGGPVGTGFQSVFQRLRIKLTTRSGAGTAQIDTTFTALNTTKDTPAGNGCSEGRPTP
ncbi:hypothetical protein COUCH_33640 [Couchioplanes caeruleus]|uniref:hypothetical protein n=1 Tax=Couchioplanes caeruleus TaxID=56438 RepID=UPI0020BF40BE|nr:hypothetical protein [Couchioplanes caeruleus]UQU63879.1 hypothetical protein COUCH_33640 [Couchioplanes caeruleus]